MRLCVLCLGFLAIAIDPPKEKTDLETIQGEWKMAALEIRGKAVEESKLKGTTLVIKGDKYTVRANKTDREVSIKLDPAQKPKQIDMSFPDGADQSKIAKGIYKLEGNKLIICRDQGTEMPRPKEFATSDDNDIFIVTWERVTPAKK